MAVSILTGKIIDVSRAKHIDEAEHHFREPGNHYRLASELGVETYDCLYSQDYINETKYYRILLYEWFLLVKPGGKIIIDFNDNEILDLAGLKREIGELALYKGKHKCEDSGTDSHLRLTIEKTGSAKRVNADIYKWTFGIVTNGKRLDFIRKSIESIRALKIPEYEIIICGTYSGAIDYDMRYIPFSQLDDKGWITRKKNLICAEAKYANIVVIHDRIYFDTNWHQGMKRWGNQFDVISCPVILTLKNGETSFSNWETMSPGFKLEDDRKLFHTNGKLDTDDWDKNVIIPGPLIIIKKDIWELEPWNESLFWGDAEDIELSHRQHRSGIMIRLNPYSIARAASVSGVTYWAYYEKDPKKLGRFIPGLPYPLLAALRILDMLGFRRDQKLVQYGIRKAKRYFSASSWKEEKSKQ